MRLGYVMAPGRGETNVLLADLAVALKDRGWRLAGTVQTDLARQGTHRCDMDLRILPDGPVLCITQDLGREAAGCRLDPAALETAVGLSTRALDEGAEIVIVNKFGKHEAEGRGFREFIAEAVARGIPVVVGTNKLSLGAFLAFSGGTAEALTGDVAALVDWAEAAAAGRATV